jgi:putative tryptophan/tyrosine transport system substrate-binding protein
MRRRDFIAFVGGVTASWPLAAPAQKQPNMPVIGFLSFRSAEESATSVAAFRGGLSEMGYVEGRSVHIAFRWAEGHQDQLPTLAADLVDNLRVSVIAAVGGGFSSHAAKAVTKTIPIVFTYGGDPVKDGIVASLSRPKDNITGITWFGSESAGKRVALLHDFVPTATTVALVLNPSNPEGHSESPDAQDAAHRINLKLIVLNASTEREIDTAFATLAQQQIGAVAIASDPFLLIRREQIVSLAARYAIPAIYPNREFVTEGGLVSYGNSVTEAYRHAGLYVGRLLRGAGPSDLPVERLTKFEFVINLTTSKTLGLTIPASFLSLADELIE